MTLFEQIRSLMSIRVIGFALWICPEPERRHLAAALMPYFYKIIEENRQ